MPIKVSVALSPRQLEEAIALLKEAVRLKSHNALIREDLARHYNQGIYLNNQGKAQEAIAVYRKAIRLTPNYTPPTILWR